MKIIRNILFIVIPAMIILTGCSTIKVSDYANRKPVMIPEEFFDGHLTAHGIVKNRAGEVIRYFNADIKAYWEDSAGTLEEDFIFDDGEKQRRVWKLTRQGDNSYVGTAGDVIGEAKGEIAGNSMFLEYVLEIPYSDNTIHLSIDDRMYLVNPNTLINESEMTKFGFRVGEILLVIQKM
ncbi:MAG: DUF3833 domain-containing protein [Desulfobacterales bacterium]|nr:DUF3833 domain-containing protein [Desulfobacterales bacterium]